MTDKPRLFSMVHCRAYLRKVKDGVHIDMYNLDGSTYSGRFVQNHDQVKAIACKSNPDDPIGGYMEIADLSEFCGQAVEKVYRERIEENFTGCVVGYTTVKVKGLLGTDWNDDPYSGDFGFCFKETTEAPKVAVVYFKNNCKRLVPLNDLEEIT